MPSLSPSQQAQFDEMSMAEKISILLVQLGEDITSTIFANMDIESITEISKFIASNKTVEKAVASAVLEEFYAIFQSVNLSQAAGLNMPENFYIEH
jgi:flagellar motor switch protein FliG